MPESTESDMKKIERLIRNSIAWAATKDRELILSVFAPAPELFWFSPRDDGTIHGYEAFVELTDNFFMSADFQHLRYEIRQLQINISETGTVAWFNARLDDFNLWQGQPADWEDVRWTGVLEKRSGDWVIVQMHFSEPADRK
jgi:hypothetical protein